MSKAKPAKAAKVAVAIDATALHAALHTARTAYIASLDQQITPRLKFERDTLSRITVTQIAAFAAFAPERATIENLARIGATAAKYTMRKMAFTLAAIERGDLASIYNKSHDFMQYDYALLRMIKDGNLATLADDSYIAEAAKMLIKGVGTTNTQRSSTQDCWSQLFGCIKLNYRTMTFDRSNPQLIAMLESIA